MEKTSTSPDLSYRTTAIPELDAFIDTELKLIGEEENREEQQQLWRIFWNGVKAILSAQVQLPAEDDSTSSERVSRRVSIVKNFLKEINDNG